MTSYETALAGSPTGGVYMKHLNVWYEVPRKSPVKSITQQLREGVLMPVATGHIVEEKNVTFHFTIADTMTISIDDRVVRSWKDVVGILIKSGDVVMLSDDDVNDGGQEGPVVKDIQAASNALRSALRTFKTSVKCALSNHGSTAQELDLAVAEKNQAIEWKNQAIVDREQALAQRDAAVIQKDVCFAELVHTRADLARTQADLARTQADLVRMHTDLERTQADLAHAQADLSSAHVRVFKAQIESLQTSSVRQYIELGGRATDLALDYSENMASLYKCMSGLQAQYPVELGDLPLDADIIDKVYNWGLLAPETRTAAKEYIRELLNNDYVGLQEYTTQHVHDGNAKKIARQLQGGVHPDRQGAIVHADVDKIRALAHSVIRLHQMISKM